MTRPSRSLSKNSLPVGGSRITRACVWSACRGACPSPVWLSGSAPGGAFFAACGMVSSFLLRVGTAAATPSGWPYTSLPPSQGSVIAVMPCPQAHGRPLIPVPQGLDVDESPVFKREFLHEPLRPEIVHPHVNDDRDIDRGARKT